MSKSPDQHSSGRGRASADKPASRAASVPDSTGSSGSVDKTPDSALNPAKMDRLSFERNLAVDRNGHALPESFRCPLTLTVMKDPVMDSDGNTFERAAIIDWLAKNETNPVTKRPLAATDLFPNRSLKGAILHAMGPEFARTAGEAKSVSTSRSSNSDDRDCGDALEGFREVIGRYLSEIGSSLGQNLSLNTQGVCAFIHGRFTVVIEVPEVVGSFFIYTPLQNISIVMNAVELKNKALELNYLQQETRGGCLSIDPINKDLIFSYTERVRSVRGSADFRTILESFLDTASRLFHEINA